MQHLVDRRSTGRSCRPLTTGPRTAVPLPSLTRIISPTRDPADGGGVAALLAGRASTTWPDLGVVQGGEEQRLGHRERLLQPAEHALAVLGHRHLRTGLVAQRRELAQQLALLVVELGRGLHQQRDAEVAAAVAAQPRHAASGDGDPGARLGAGRDVDRHAAPRRRPGRRARPPGSPSVTWVPSAAAVIGTFTTTSRLSPLRLNTSCVGHGELDVQVAGRAAAGPDLALGVQVDAVAGRDAGRDLHVDGAVAADAALAGALPAGVRDDRAVAAAGRARLAGADVAEERALHLGDVAAAVAGARR